MPFVCYVHKNFYPHNEKKIEAANAILEEYAGLELSLTLRQLYYQFVARGIIENSYKEYKKLQQLINDARLAGRIDWDAIEDRTRNLMERPVWNDPAAILRETSARYREPKWDQQKTHVEVWVEKDALLGVIERACQRYATPHFSCRGYTSQSEVWNAAERLRALDKPAVILHLGDHDPSGVDMSRDIQDRMELFEAYNVTVKRIALTMAQITAKKPPPNPAKITDSRAKGYIAKFGVESWELDALDPKYIIDLIHKETRKYLDLKTWDASLAQETKRRKILSGISDKFPVVARFLRFKND